MFSTSKPILHFPAFNLLRIPRADTFKYCRGHSFILTDQLGDQITSVAFSWGHQLRVLQGLSEVQQIHDLGDKALIRRPAQAVFSNEMLAVEEGLAERLLQILLGVTQQHVLQRFACRWQASQTKPMSLCPSKKKHDDQHGFNVVRDRSTWNLKPPGSNFNASSKIHAKPITSGFRFQPVFQFRLGSPGFCTAGRLYSHLWMDSRCSSFKTFTGKTGIFSEHSCASKVASSPSSKASESLQTFSP